MRPGRMSLAIVAVVLLLLALPAAALAFSDVPSYHSYRDAIEDLSSRGIINGFTDGTFGPEKPVTRQQFAKMIVGTLGLAVNESDTSPFTDLGPDDPASPYPHEYVAVAWKNGITTGKTATSFGPGEKISRAQVITMVVRAAENMYGGLLSTPGGGYTATWNPTYSSIHGPNSRKAEYNGMLVGLPLGEMDPWASMPRGEVAQVLHNLIWLLPWNAITYTGSGDDVISVSKGPGPALAYITGNEAERFFSVTSYGPGNDYLDLLASELDPYVGIRPIDFDVDEHVSLLEVEAEGPWTIEFRSLNTARVLDTPGTMTGSGDEVIALRGQPTTLYIEGNTSGHYFGVVGRGAAWDLIVNELDPYAGRSMVDPDVTFLEIQAVGPWSITAEP